MNRYSRSELDTRLSAGIKTVPAVAAMLVGFLVLVGWTFEIPALQSVLPGFVSMKPNTAICFALSGLALYIAMWPTRSKGQTQVLRLLSALVLLIALATLCQFIFGWDLHIDELFFADPMTTARTVAPGRMAVTSTIAFSLFALGLLLMNWEPRVGSRPTEWMAVIVFVLGLASLCQHLYTSTLFDVHLGMTPMALHTAPLFMLLALGLVWTRPDLGLLNLVMRNEVNPVERRIYMLLGISCVFLLVAHIATFFSAYESKARAAAIGQTQEIRRHLWHMVSTLQHVNTDAQQYVLTGSVAYVDAIEEGSASVQTSLNRVASAISVEEASERLAELKVNVAEHVEKSRKIASAARAGGQAAAENALLSSGIDRTTATIRKTVAAMDAEQRATVQLRAAEEDASVKRMYFSLAFAALLYAVFLVLAVITIRRSFGVSNAAEHALRTSQAYLNVTLRSIGDAVITTKVDGSIIGLNPMAEKMTGWTAESAKDRPVTEILKFVPDEHQPEVSDTSETIYGVLAHRGGSETPVAQSTSPLLDESGRLRGYVIVLRNFAAERKARLAILDANRQLHEAVAASRRAEQAAAAASEAKSSFLATMSHEIRTPMYGVIGSVDMLWRSSLRPDQMDLVNTVKESATSLLIVINDILDFAKIEAGKIKLESEEVSPLSVIESVCDSLGPLADSKQVTVVLYTAPTLPRLIYTDAVRLRQILNNLLSNAIKFSAGQPVVGHVSVRATWHPESGIQLVVRDNGIGMPPTLVSTLFEPFSQADSSTTRRFGGSGLGLSITKRLIDLFGGTLEVETTLGGGTTFTAIVPARPVAGGEEHAGGGHLTGVNCLLRCEDAEKAGIWSEYLAWAGAQVVVSREEEGAQWPETTREWQEPILYVIDAPDRHDLESAEEVMRQWPAQRPGTRYLVLTRGRNRSPRKLSSNIVLVEADGIHLETFLYAAGIAAQQIAARAPEASQAPETQREVSDDAPLILVAEDNDVNQKVIARQLRLLGYRCHVAANGRQALHAWRTMQPSLLLTDLHMPQMDGYELARAIRNEGHLGRMIPIIAFTANISKGESERCKAAGMDDYLSKPVDLAALEAMLGRWFKYGDDNGHARDGIGAVPPHETLPMFDVEALKTYVGVEKDIQYEVLGDFLESAEKISGRLERAIDESNWEEVSQLGHRLKSSARTVGASLLGEICNQLEECAQVDDQAGVLTGYEQFQRVLKDAQSRIAEYRRALT